MHTAIPSARHLRFIISVYVPIVLVSLALPTGCDDSSGGETMRDTGTDAPSDVRDDTGLEDTGTTPDSGLDTVTGDTRADGGDGEDTSADTAGDTIDTADTTLDTGDVSGCLATETVCGSECCADTEVCGRNTRCCARETLCGDSCCAAGEVCEGAVCLPDCGDNARCVLSDGTATCCGTDEICTSGACFLPETDCTDFIDCGVDEYCETTLGKCLPQPGGDTCQAVPTGGAVLPTLLWHWDGADAVMPTYNQVMMAPMVARVDADLVPDVVFITFVTNYGGDGILRVVSGADGSSIFDVTDPAHRTVPGGQVAIGDIDGDTRVEIVACHQSGDLIAFNHDGTLAWQSTDDRIACHQAAPAIADLDRDGTPEVFVRYSVVDGATGNLEWHNDCVGTGGWATTAHSPCDYTTAADLDGQGGLELVGGNVAYDAQGNVFWDRTADFRDGYPAIGDFDGDDKPDVVVIYSAFTPSPYQGDHEIRILKGLDGSTLHGPVDINQANVPAADQTSNEVGGGGPATIANFDSDPAAEIALAGAYSYTVFEDDLTVKWTANSYDRSSRKTGSSVFDFDGDGVAEAVYNDHYWLRVYDGTNGDVRFCQCNTSATLWEYPVIADVNFDGHAEIVLASNDYSVTGCPTITAEQGLDPCVEQRLMAGETAGTHGIRVFASPDRDWVGTRGIWNQHTYHVTNVSDDGRIPQFEPTNAANPFLNSFRQNVQPGATNQPDVVPVEASVDIRECFDRMIVNVRLLNEGWAAAPAGTPATVYVDRDGTWVKVGRVVTTRTLLPGESEVLAVPYELMMGEGATPVTFRIVVNDPGDMPLQSLAECDTSNNTIETSAACAFN